MALWTWIVDRYLRRFGTDDTRGTVYCGVALTGGWCKRRKGHAGRHACA